MPMLSTGGYNDSCLKFVSNCFNTRIVKCRDFQLFLITAIDYLNKWTNDCFYHISGLSENTLNHSGKIKPEKEPIKHYFSLGENLYPYLLINLRSGVTFTRVDSKTSFRNAMPVSGSPIGFTFYMGVLRLLNIFNDPTEAIEAGITGDSSNIDFDVGEIYGGDYSKLGLPSQMLASSFAKVKDIEQDDMK